MHKLYSFIIILTLSLVIPLLAQYPTVSISQIQTVPPGYEISPYNGQTVVTGGIVTVPTGIFHVGSGVTFIIEEQTAGRFSGIAAYNSSSQENPTLMPGDSVTLAASVADGVGAMTTLTVEVIPTIDHGYSEPLPEIITASLIDSTNNSDFLAERYEGVFCRINNITIDSVIPYSNTSIWLCHDPTGHCIIRECSDSISFLPPVGTHFNYVQGVVYQRQGVFELWPRYTRDCMARTGGPIITNVTTRPLQPSSEGNIIFLANVVDVDTITDVILYWVNQNGQYVEQMEGWGRCYRFVLEPQASNTKINYYLMAVNNHGDTTKSPSEAPISFFSFNVLPRQICHYIPGDVNDDGLVNWADVDYLTDFFMGNVMPSPQMCFYRNSGRITGLYVAADVNGDCRNTAGDVTRLIVHITRGYPIFNCRFFPPILPTPQNDKNKTSPIGEGQGSD